MNALEKWHQEISVFKDLRTNWNDKLEVIDGHSYLKKGDGYRNLGTSIVQNPSALASHLNSLISDTANQSFEFLKSEKCDEPAYYEKIADFKREFKCLKDQISDLEYTFRSHDLNDKFSSKLYSQLFDLGYSFLKEIKAYKSTLVKPPLSERPVKHITYDERTELTSIKWSYPKRVPLKETVAAAKKALSLVRYSFYDYFRFPLALLMYITSIILTAFKIVLWNPIERLILGKVKTPSLYLPFSELLQIYNRHEKAYQSFTTQILHCPVITEEVAAAFEELVHHAKKLDLKNAILAAENFEEFKPFLKEDEILPIAEFLDILKLKQESQESNFPSLVCLNNFKSLYERAICFCKSYQEKNTAQGQSIKEFLKIHLTLNALLVINPHCVNPFITPKVLERLFKAAASSKTCKKIALSSDLVELPPVQNFLAQNSYYFLKGGKFEKIYSRS